jgi:type I restriction enzyme, R subunit
MPPRRQSKLSASSNQNLVMEYSHEQAVADSVNVGFEGLSHPHSDQRTWICFNVDNRDKLTRKVRWQQLDKD